MFGYRRILDTDAFDWKCHQYRPFRCWIGCCVQKVVSYPDDHSTGDTGTFAFTQRSNLLILS